MLDLRSWSQIIAFRIEAVGSSAHFGRKSAAASWHARMLSSGQALCMNVTIHPAAGHAAAM